MGGINANNNSDSDAKSIVGRHWKTNQVHSVDTHNDVPDPRHATTRFHRGHLHSALLEHVPRESIHLGKKTVRAEVDHQSVSLYFDDGTSARGDILIGADGLRSVRFTRNWVVIFRSRSDRTVACRLSDNHLSPSISYGSAGRCLCDPHLMHHW